MFHLLIVCVDFFTYFNRKDFSKKSVAFASLGCLEAPGYYSSGLIL